MPQLYNVNKRKNQWGHETHISHALEVANLNVVVSNLLRTCFNSQSRLNSIILVIERHFHMFLTICSPVSLNSRKCDKDLFEPNSRDRLWIIKISYLLNFRGYY